VRKNLRSTGRGRRSLSQALQAPKSSTGLPPVDTRWRGGGIKQRQPVACVCRRIGEESGADATHMRSQRIAWPPYVRRLCDCALGMGSRCTKRASSTCQPPLAQWWASWPRNAERTVRKCAGGGHQTRVCRPGGMEGSRACSKAVEGGYPSMTTPNRGTALGTAQPATTGSPAAAANAGGTSPRGLSSITRCCSCTGRCLG
jgi:hypothetical protein